MSPAHVLEPTYHSLKERLLEGAWPLGLRLDASRLADDLGVSVTPVRDCLNRLVGERLVDFRPQEGYRVALLRERDLRDMLELVGILLDRSLSEPSADGLARSTHRPADHPGRTAALFFAIACQSGNSVLADTVESLGARLHAARAAELQVIPDAREEISALARLWVNGDDRIRSELAAYHERRREAASKLIELLEMRPI